MHQLLEHLWAASIHEGTVQNVLTPVWECGPAMLMTSNCAPHRSDNVNEINRHKNKEKSGAGLPGVGA